MIHTNDQADPSLYNFPTGDNSEVVIPILINVLHIPDDSLVIDQELMIPTYGFQELPFDSINLSSDEQHLYFGPQNYALVYSSNASLLSVRQLCYLGPDCESYSLVVNLVDAQPQILEYTIEADLDYKELDDPGWTRDLVTSKP